MKTTIILLIASACLAFGQTNAVVKTNTFKPRPVVDPLAQVKAGVAFREAKLALLEKRLKVIQEQYNENNRRQDLARAAGRGGSRQAFIWNQQALMEQMDAIRREVAGLNLEIHDARKRYGLPEVKPAKPKK